MTSLWVFLLLILFFVKLHSSHTVEYNYFCFSLLNPYLFLKSYMAYNLCTYRSITMHMWDWTCSILCEHVLYVQDSLSNVKYATLYHISAQQTQDSLSKIKYATLYHISAQQIQDSLSKIKYATLYHISAQ